MPIFSIYVRKNIPDPAKLLASIRAEKSLLVASTEQSYFKTLSLPLISAMDKRTNELHRISHVRCDSFNLQVFLVLASCLGFCSIRCKSFLKSAYMHRQD